jgi:hypothetical protein
MYQFLQYLHILPRFIPILLKLVLIFTKIYWKLTMVNCKNNLQFTNFPTSGRNFKIFTMAKP